MSSEAAVSRPLERLVLPEVSMGASDRFDNAKRRRSDAHDRQRQLTPAYVLEPVRNLLGGIGLDPCTEPDNPTGADKFYTPPQDGAALPWDAETVFCNPPYGEARNRWVARCIDEGKRRRVVLLMPSHTDTRISQRAMELATSVLFVRGRLRFGIPRKAGMSEAASHGSALYGYGVDLSPLAPLGVVMSRQNMVLTHTEANDGGHLLDESAANDNAHSSRVSAAKEG